MKGTMPKQKRYENEKQILEEIQRTHDQINHLREESEILDSFAEAMREHPHFLAFNSDIIESLDDYRELARKRRKRAGQLEEHRLPRLGQALAAIRTGTFPEIVQDESVVL